MSLRWNGSTLGSRRNVDAGPFSGCWSLRSQAAYSRDQKWPNIKSPSDISGLSIWLDGKDSNTFYDATTGGSVVTAGNAVARWEDKSSNALHYTQSTLNNRPLLVSGGGLDFDGSNDQMQATNGSNALSGKTAYTMFIVFNADAFSNAPVLIRVGSNSANDEFIELLMTATDLLAAGRSAGSGDWRTYRITGNISLSASTTYLLMFSRTGTHNATLQINGVNRFQYTGGVPVAPNIGANTTATIGAYANNLYYNGRICEIVAYDSVLSAANNISVTNYLNAKWSIYQ